MKRFLVFMLLMNVWAIGLTKTVSGPELIDINETLGVSIEIEGDNEYVERLEDDIPSHFIATSMPASCQQTESMITCSFGQSIQGKLVVSYNLLARGTGIGIIGTPRLYYAGGVKTIDFSRQYSVGRPKIAVDVSGDEMLLPEEEINVKVSMKNTGIMAVADAVLLLEYGENRTDEISLGPGEVVEKWFMLGEAGDRGVMRVKATVAWDNSSSSDTLEIIFISPSISVTRDVQVKWQAEGKELVKYIEVNYRARNNGTAPGNVSFQSGDSFVLSPSETHALTKTYSEFAPAEKVSVTDSRGYSYGVFSFEEETPDAKKGFFVLVYEYVASEFSPWLILGVLVGAIYFSTKFKNPNIKAGFLVLAIVSALLLYSHFSVGALRLPVFSPMSSGDSVLLQLPGNLSGFS